MIPDKLKQLIQLLTEKTRNKKAIWNKVSGNNQFKLSIADGIAITIDTWDDNWENDFYGLIIFNSNGDPIERYTSGDHTPKEDNDLLRKFHKAASDSYYKVEETMDSLLQSINSQDIIGTAEEKKDLNQAPDDDDLPF